MLPSTSVAQNRQDNVDVDKQPKSLVENSQLLCPHAQGGNERPFRRLCMFVFQQYDVVYNMTYYLHSENRSNGGGQLR